jgi:hypothetical protein
LPIRKPSDRTLQLANSNDFANERSNGATTPVEYDTADSDEAGHAFQKEAGH